MPDFIMSNDDVVLPQSAGSQMVYPGSTHGQHRPMVVKRDSDVAAPVIMPMGNSAYNYAPARNKKASG